MRRLSVKQKNMLRKEAEKMLQQGRYVSVEHLEISKYWEIFNVNQFENFDSAIESFLWDYEWARR